MYIIHLSFLKRLQNFFSEGYCTLAMAKELQAFLLRRADKIIMMYVGGENDQINFTPSWWSLLYFPLSKI
jgi:hypothetical protein